MLGQLDRRGRRADDERRGVDRLVGRLEGLGVLELVQLGRLARAEGVAAVDDELEHHLAGQVVGEEPGARCVVCLSLCFHCPSIIFLSSARTMAVISGTTAGGGAAAGWLPASRAS